MSLPLRKHIEKDGFLLRGLEVSRIDAFSDVVFGFALTLLVVSLEVPKTYAELQVSLRGFLPFAVSFYFLMSLWVGHYKFFRRFGTHDMGTIAINATLLFVVLFYVYPLKFLFTFLSNMLLGTSQQVFANDGQVRQLMVLYAVGFTAIYLLMAALYWNALRQKDHLELSYLEVLLTRSYIGDAAGVASIGVLSCVVALILPAHLVGLSGWVYGLNFPFKRLYRVYTRRRIARKVALHQLTKTP